MSEANDNPASTCCDGSNAGDACCGGSAPKQRFDYKTLIFLVVMLVAMGVGIYSFRGRAPACATGTDCDSLGSSCCPTATK